MRQKSNLKSIALKARGLVMRLCLNPDLPEVLQIVFTTYKFLWSLIPWSPPISG